METMDETSTEMDSEPIVFTEDAVMEREEIYSISGDDEVSSTFEGDYSDEELELEEVVELREIEESEPDVEEGDYETHLMKDRDQSLAKLMEFIEGIDLAHTPINDMMLDVLNETIDVSTKQPDSDIEYIFTKLPNIILRPDKSMDHKFYGYTAMIKSLYGMEAIKHADV